MLWLADGGFCVLEAIWVCMHLFADWFLPLLLGTAMALPVSRVCMCVCVCVCVLGLCTWRSVGKLRGCIWPGTAKHGFGKRGPSPF